MKLSDRKVAKVKADLASGVSQSKIAKTYRISRSLVSDIATGRVHKDVPWPDGQPPPPKKPGGQRKKLDHDPTNERILELEAEVVVLTEERNRERAKSKANAKIQGLFRAMVGVLNEKIVPVKPLPSWYKPKSLRGKIIEEHVVMHLSDGHHDQIVRPEECGGLEHHNFAVSCCRAERYVDTLLQWTQETLAPQFRFPVLNVLAYGDFTSGEIHGHVERSYFRNQFQNCLAIGKLHALMYRDLAPYFERVNVVYVPGNHGRRSIKKDHHGAWNNWDYLTAEIARLYCADIANMDFLVPDAFSVNLDIDGVGFNVSHGDDVRGSLNKVA
jgi:transposase